MKNSRRSQLSANSGLPNVPENLGRTSPAAGNATPSLEMLNARLESAHQQIAQLWQIVLKLNEILYQDANGNVEISSSGRIKLVAESNICLDAGTKVTAQTQSGASLEVAFGNINLNSSYKVNVNAANSIRLEADSKIECESASVKVLTPAFKHQGASFHANGLIQCDTLKANVVTALTYSPGAGNIW